LFTDNGDEMQDIFYSNFEIDDDEEEEDGENAFEARIAAMDMEDMLASAEFVLRP
jgi:hypothetical protein